MSGQWASSNRRATLPKNWANIRGAVARRAQGLCEATRHVTGCDGRGNECDHIGDPLDHTLGNLQWLSPACHRAKTQEESKKAKAKTNRKRSKPLHPGVQGETP
jgi:hypothetical protein